MSDVSVVVQTVWDILASALNDEYFWMFFVGVALSLSLIVRHRRKKLFGVR